METCVEGTWGEMVEGDWGSKVVSSHRGALSRQVTEGVRISSEGLDSLLNSKNEFGANNLSELVVCVGNQTLLTVEKRRAGGGETGGGRGTNQERAQEEEG